MWMVEIPDLIECRFKDTLVRESVPARERPYFWRWVCFYVDHCERNGLEEIEPESRAAFDRMLQGKGQGLFQRRQAARAIELYLRILDTRAELDVLGVGDLGQLDEVAVGWTRVLRQLRESIQTRQYSPNTARTYVMWAHRFRDFLRGKSVDAVDASDAAVFFTYLACKKQVVASTQNQAFSALLFLFRHVLRREFDGFEGVVRAKRTKYIPVVLSRAEVDAVLGRLEHPYDLIVSLLYGCGLRVFEGVNLRIGCLNFDAGVLTVHDGKGRKDRTVPLPECLVPALERQVSRVRIQLGKDIEAGFAGAFLPGAWARKFRHGAKELPWQWLFPARRFSLVPETEELRRYHAHERKVGAAIRDAARAAGLMKRVTAHTFRHSFASHLLEANYDIRTIQELLGHGSLETTMIYTHTLRSRTIKEARSPLDF